MVMGKVTWGKGHNRKRLQTIWSRSGKFSHREGRNDDQGGGVQRGGVTKERAWNCLLWYSAQLRESGAKVEIKVYGGKN